MRHALNLRNQEILRLYSQGIPRKQIPVVPDPNRGFCIWGTPWAVSDLVGAICVGIWNKRAARLE